MEEMSDLTAGEGFLGPRRSWALLTLQKLRVTSRCY